MKKPGIVFSKAVGTSEFESPTSSMSTRRSNQLSYAPIASEEAFYTASLFFSTRIIVWLRLKSSQIYKLFEDSSCQSDHTCASNVEES